MVSTTAHSTAPELYLASASPRRRELLGQLGVLYRVLSIDIDEAVDGAEAAADYVVRIARAKALAGWEQSEHALALPVLGADTAVVIGDEILGKPEGQQQALQMLKKLSGSIHQVYSAVAVRRGQLEEYCLVKTRVGFRALSTRECEVYWLTGEPRDKAGGYGIQGFGAAFVAHLEGSYSGVVGLPLLETAGLLESFGVTIWNH